MIRDITIELCAGSVDDVLTAKDTEIDRIELNCALELGGLTPTLSTLREVKRITDKPVMCMVRSRTAGFTYSQASIDVMYEDANLLLSNKADGLVFGFLNEDRTIDVQTTRLFTALCHLKGKEAVFHKAFDECADMDKAIRTLIDLNVDRILTDGRSGGKILDGASNLKYLNDRYGHLIQILPGGGVRPDNIRELLDSTGLRQVHMTAKSMRSDITSFAATDLDILKECLENLR